MGREIVSSGTIPTTDVFSYTRYGEPFYNQGWLAQVIMYGLHQLGGVALIIVVQAVVLALAYGVLMLLCIRRSSALRLSAAVILLMIMPISFNNWNVRPQSYAFPLFVAFLSILTMWRTGGEQVSDSHQQTARHYLWLLPPLMMVWVNLHGSFVLGGVLIAFTFGMEWLKRFVSDYRLLPPALMPPQPHPTDAEKADTRLAMNRPSLHGLFFWGVATAVAMLVNPRGLGVLAYVYNLLTTSAVTNLVTEWAPPTTRDAGGVLFFVFLILCGLVLAYTRRFPDPLDMLLAVAFLWLALGASRNVVWFGMVVAPLLTVQMSTWFHKDLSATDQPRKKYQGVPLMNATVMGLIGLLLVLGLPWVKPSLGLPPELGALLSPDTPVQAVEALKEDEDRPKHLFHAMSYGSYLIWAAPRQPVFADPRIELYPFEQWRDYINLNSGNNVEYLLKKYEIDGLLLDNEDQAQLLQSVRADPTWDVRYEDEQTTYLVREKGTTQASRSST